MGGGVWKDAAKMALVHHSILTFVYIYIYKVKSRINKHLFCLEFMLYRFKIRSMPKFGEPKSVRQ